MIELFTPGQVWRRVFPHEHLGDHVIHCRVLDYADNGKGDLAYLTCWESNKGVGPEQVPSLDRIMSRRELSEALACYTIMTPEFPRVFSPSSSFLRDIAIGAMPHVARGAV